MLLPLLMVITAAAPKGLIAATPVEIVTQLDASLPDLVKAGPKLTALLASKAEIKKSVMAMKPNPADVEMIMRSAMEEQTPKPDLPATLETTAATLVPGDGNPSVRLYDAAGMRLNFELLKRGPKSYALFGAPQAVPDSNLDDDIEWLHNHGATSEKPEPKPLFFVKKNGAWAEVPFPPAEKSQAHCVAGMHVTAKQIAESQQRFFAANKKYTKSFGKLDFDGSNAFSTASHMESADAEHFTAEVHRLGGVVRITETNKPVDVKPCKLQR